MVIREMTREECLSLLARTRLARLSCAQENQPYVVPVSLAYDESDESSPCLYGETTLGQKVEWMRANPLVCVEIDELISDNQWASVVVFGHYEELPEASGNDDPRIQAPKRPKQFGKAMPDWTGDTIQPEPEREDRNDERERAWQVLKDNPNWWATGWAAWVARHQHNSAETYKIIYYKILIDRITGHEATRDVKKA